MTTFQDRENYWIQGGGNPALASIMAAISTAEKPDGTNSINPDSRGTQSAGLWQINSGNWSALQNAGIISSSNDLTDPVTNARAAAWLVGRSGLDNWTTWWSTDGGNTRAGSGNGSAAQYLPSGAQFLASLVNSFGASNVQNGTLTAVQQSAVNSAASLVNLSTGSTGSSTGTGSSGGASPSPTPGATIPPGTGPFSGQPVQPTNGIPNPLSGVADAISQGVTNVQKTAQNIALEAFLGALAIALIGGGLAWAAASNKDVQEGVGTVADAAAKSP